MLFSHVRTANVNFSNAALGFHDIGRTEQLMRQFMSFINYIIKCREFNVLTVGMIKFFHVLLIFNVIIISFGLKYGDGEPAFLLWSY